MCVLRPTVLNLFNAFPYEQFAEEDIKTFRVYTLAHSLLHCCLSW